MSKVRDEKDGHDPLTWLGWSPGKPFDLRVPGWEMGDGERLERPEGSRFSLFHSYLGDPMLKTSAALISGEGCQGSYPNRNIYPGMCVSKTTSFSCVKPLR